MPDFDIDSALLVPEPPDQWQYCHGDMSGWTYGAMWYNPARQQIMATRGLDGEDMPEIWAHDIEVPLDIRQAIQGAAEAEFPDPEDEDEVKIRIEQETEAWQEAERERREAAIRLPVYTFCCDDAVDDYDVESIKRSMDLTDAQWDSLELYEKWLYVADHYGLDEMDCYPDHLTKAELQTRLGNYRLH